MCNGSRMTGGGLPVNARCRRRLGLRLGLLYSRKATALAGAERRARGVEPGLIRPETRAKSPESDPRTHAIVTGLRLGKQGLPLTRLVLKVRYCSIESA